MQTVWYTVKEVAEMFRVCEQTVRNWIKGIFYDKGKARAYKSDIRLKAMRVRRSGVRDFGRAKAICF